MKLKPLEMTDDEANALVAALWAALDDPSIRLNLEFRALLARLITRIKELPYE